MEDNIEIKKKEEQPKSPRFDRSDLLSILAVIVSLSALGVSVYEAGILREQSALMQEQQKAAVWPYMEVVGSYSYNERVEVKYAFKNKGVGPAKIAVYKMSINGEEFSNYEEISAFFKKLLPGAKDLSVVAGGLGGVVAADEKVEVFYLNVDGYPGAYDIIRDLDIKYEFCYCSIYDDCWYLNSNIDEPETGCK